MFIGPLAATAIIDLKQVFLEYSLYVPQLWSQKVNWLFLSMSVWFLFTQKFCSISGAKIVVAKMAEPWGFIWIVDGERTGEK